METSLNIRLWKKSNRRGGDYMLTINEQEILVDDLEEIESKLFDIIEQLDSDDKLIKAWCIIYMRLQKEKEKESKMKAEN